MDSSLTLATAHSGGGIPSPLTILLVVAGIGYVLWSRMQGQPLKAKRLLVLPLVFTVIGVTDLSSSTAPNLSAVAITFLVASAVISAALGAARGRTIELFPRDGELWQRYRRSSVQLWIALIGTKVVLDVIAHAAGAAAGAGTNTLLLALGLSLLGEAAVVAPRAMSTGLPFATDHDEDKPPARAQPSAPRLNGLVESTPPVERAIRYRPEEQPSTPTPSREAVAVTDEPVWRSPSTHDGIDWLSRQIDQPGEEPASRTAASRSLADALIEHHKHHHDHKHDHGHRHGRERS